MTKQPVGSLPPSKPPHRPAPPRRLVCAPAEMSLHDFADRASRNEESIMFQLLRLWRTSCHANTRRHSAGGRRDTTRFRPQLDTLEHRVAPATLTWTGSATQNWSNPNNWAEHTT